MNELKEETEAIDTSVNIPEEESAKEYKKEKFIALYRSRKILAKHGTMQERQICAKQLKRMKKLGIKSV